MQNLVSRVTIGAALGFAVSSVSMAADIPKNDAYAPPEAYGLLLSGIGDFAGGYRWVNSDEDGDTNAPIVSGAGRFSIPFYDRMSVQFDADGEFYFGDGEEDAQGVVMTGAHVSLRDPNLGLLGIFGAVGQGLQESDQDDRQLGYLVGGEGQYYWNNITLYAQAGWADFTFQEGADTEGFDNGWFVRGVARWFVLTDAMVEGEVSYGETDNYIDGDDAGEFWNWGVKGKMRVSQSMPIYGVLGYRGGNYDSTSEGDVMTDHVVYAGISVLVGADNLRDNDRRGATLDLPFLPGRAAAVMQGLD